MNSDLRLYTFVNFYLSSIQQGIQSAHVVHSLFVKYPTEDSNKLLWDWAKNDRTMIVLNGGANDDLHQMFDLVKTLKIDVGIDADALPFESFCEDQYSLGGVMTSFGVVVPKELWDTKFDVNLNAYVYEADNGSQYIYDVNCVQYQFIKMMKSCGLAR